MLVTALTLVGYSVGISLVSAGIKKSCNKTANKRIAEQIAVLPEDHTEQEELDIIKRETLKSTAKFSLITAGVGIAGAAAATGIITTFDNPIDNNLLSDSTEDPISVETDENGVTTETYSDGTIISTF